MATVMLCADEVSLRSPELLGLEGYELDGLPWLACMWDAGLARRALQGPHDISEVWVVSSDEVEPINLAAALKKDAPDVRVALVCPQDSGSVRSRAAAAGIDEVLTMAGFLDRFSSFAKGRGSVEPDAPMKAGSSSGGEVAIPMKVGSSSGSEATAPICEETAPIRPSSKPAEKRGDLAVNATGAATGSRRGYVLTIVSGRGGVGRSTLAALFSLVAARSLLSVAVVDADLQFGDMDAMLGQHDCLRSDQCLRTRDFIPQGAVCPGKVFLVGAPRRMERGDLVRGQIADMVRALRERFQIVVVNTGSFWDEAQLALVQESSHVLFLMDQRPSSVQMVKGCIGLCSRCGVATSPFVFAMNRCRKGEALSGVDASCALGGVKVLEFPDGGPQVEEACSVGRPQALFEEGNALVRSVAEVFSSLYPQVGELSKNILEEMAPPAKKGLFSRFRRGGGS
ncbi:MAG: P-loop NTPase [Eggerthellales bacterium]|nr:P-loop NTPase [Eggerthellales bacterium]